VSLTSGQRQGLRQLQAVAAARPGALEVIRVVEPTDKARDLALDVSIDCQGFERREAGLALRGRERLSILVPPGFPFAKPEIAAPHLRWAGTAHVQWGRHICLYQAPTVEWIPADGMYGFFDRIELWLRQASLAQLDPAGAPLHPPVAYSSAGAPLIIPRQDTPPVADEPWLGWVATEAHGESRIDLQGWAPRRDDQGEPTLPASGAAAVFLLPTTMNWEYPNDIVVLLMGLVDRGVDYGELMFHLKLSTLATGQGEPLLVVVGSAMRGTQGEHPRQHLASWRIPGPVVDDLRRALGQYLDDDGLRAAGKDAHRRAFEWLRDSKAEWCPVREERPEIVIRRDEGSPIEAFAGKTVAVWGCGALGAPIAQWLARAGAARLLLVDSAIVTPGILVRQPFTEADVGKAKATVLGDHLRAVRPDLDVTPHVGDLIRLLDEPDWHREVDVILDCSANLTVQTKLERVRRERPAPEATSLACLLLGHTAQHGIATLVRPGHSGATGDALRSVKLACLRRAELRGFAEVFWPSTARTQHFQPEPGCSDATFRGSGAETSALAGSLLTSLARDLGTSDETATAVGRLMVLPVAEHDGAATARLTFEAALATHDSENEYEVRLSRAALHELRGWIASSARRLEPASETGGLIFGQRDEAAGVIWVEQLTGPPSDSSETPAEFICGTEGIADLCQANTRAGRGSLEFLGMWHTHPDQSSDPSHRDLLGMAQLSAAAPSPLAQGLILIVGHARALADPGAGVAGADISAYLFEGTISAKEMTVKVREAETLPLPPSPAGPTRDVGLALSGGGSRAVAFHLGCLRALHDRAVLDRVPVISGVSGGSVLTAMYAYSDEDFEAFDARVCELLRRGLQGDIARRILLSPRVVQGAGTRLVAGTAAAGARAIGFAGRKLGRQTSGRPPLRRWVSRSDAFADVLERRLFGQTLMPEVRRADLGVVINACDLTTGSAFRFGSRESGTWRVGRVVENEVRVAEAVAASAAYPLLLPALDRQWRFIPMRDGPAFDQRVVLTDGGVFDNLGTSCLEPGRSGEFSTNVYDVDYVIACDAGRGLLDPQVPFGAVSRLSRSFMSTFRKAQDATPSRLHRMVEHGELRGFVMPYLGQRDSSLPHRPTDLVTRDQVADYPTDFAAMSDETIAMLAGRGEQLTRLLIERWCPEL
jgi:predicted acylesterase/phospholipase RssA/proteasome lid subunit RPN8/RPN11